MKKGISLAELLAVVVIMGILAGISVVIVRGVIENTRKNTLYAEAVAVTDAARQYCLINDSDECLAGNIFIDLDNNLSKDYTYVDTPLAVDEDLECYVESLGQGNYRVVIQNNGYRYDGNIYEVKEDGITKATDGGDPSDPGGDVDAVPIEEVDGVEMDSSGNIYTNKTQSEVVIPPYIEKDGVVYKITSIPDYSFLEDNALEKITVPDTVTYIGKDAFKHSAIKEIVIESKSLEIAEGAFADTYQLADVTFDNVTRVREDAFNHSSVKDITINGATTGVSIEKRAFAGTYSSDIVIINNAKVIEDNAFYYKKGNKDVNSQINTLIINGIDSGVTIGDSAFKDTYGNGEMTINNVKSIGSNAFYSASLQSLTITGIDSGCDILDNAFAETKGSNCDVALYNIKSIGFKGFYHSAIKTVTFYDEVCESIGSQAFVGCWALSGDIDDSIINIPDECTYESDSFEDNQWNDYSVERAGKIIFR